MRPIGLLAAFIAAGVAVFMAMSRSRNADSTAVEGSAAGTRDGTAYTADFSGDADELTATGRNPYFILEPGHTEVLRDGGDELVITVLDETRTINGVETRVVEERESEDGQVVEVSRNFFAISRRTNSVYYFGEEVDIYRDGTVVSHDGGWIAGTNGARYGMMMPGEPLLGARYYQELAPDVAMDRAEITSLDARLETTAGTLTGLLEVVETTPLEPGVRESKLYQRGRGLVRDGRLVRTSL